MENVISDTDARLIVSANLRDRLELLGWSQGELARRLNGSDDVNSRMRISRWCTGQTLPSPADLCNLADVLACSVDDIVRKRRKR